MTNKDTANMIELAKARLTAEAASVELAAASRNEQIRAAIEAGLSIRDIEAATGIPRSTVQRIATAEPLSEAQYLELANSEGLARSEVAALEAVEHTLAISGTTTET